MQMVPADERFRRFLAVSAIGYAVTGADMLVRRRGFEQGLTRFDRPRSVPDDYWPALGVSYMATIAALAWRGSRDRTAAREMAGPLLVAKAASTSLFVYRFARTRRASFALAAAVDGALLAATALLRNRP